MGNASVAPTRLEKPTETLPTPSTPAIVVVVDYQPTPPKIPPMPIETPAEPEIKGAAPIPEIKEAPKTPIEAAKIDPPGVVHVPVWRRLGSCPCEACKPVPKESPKVGEIAEIKEAPKVEDVAKAEVPKEAVSIPEIKEAPKTEILTEVVPPVPKSKGWFAGWLAEPQAKSTPKETNTAVPETKLEIPVILAIPAAASEPELNRNVRKVCVRCEQEFEVPVSNSNNKLCGRQQCFNRPDARRKCRYCDTEFTTLGAEDYRIHCNSARCANNHARRHVYRQTSKYSVKGIAWLNSIAKRDGIVIYHAQNKGELAVDYQQDGRKHFFYADGFCEATNTIYEFYGDYYHGNPMKFKGKDFNKDAKKTFGQLYEDTMRREAILRTRYNVVTIWEAEYDTQILTNALESQGSV